MELSAESLAGMIASRFLRKGGEGQWLRLLANLTQEVQAALLARLVLAADEIAVLGGVGEDGRWVLLTTQRTAWGGPNHTASCVMSSCAGPTIPSHRQRPAA